MAQYFENTNLPSKIIEFETYFLKTKFIFKADNGVFSKEKLDFGTRLLLENLPMKDMKGDILDLGCGYGVVSIILSKFIDANFDGVDVNKRALHLAEMNIKLNKVSNINFFESYCYDNVDKKYDYIITNPPIRAGKEVVYKMLREAKDHLKPNGFLYFVMRKDHGAKTAIKDISDLYETEIISREKGFFIIKCFLR
jgi:16S rRNA (guanine1207-N2)-methyltransferase